MQIENVKVVFGKRDFWFRFLGFVVFSLVTTINRNQLTTAQIARPT